jgi:multicomponent K+:H+ antiporter subunit E
MKRRGSKLLPQPLLSLVMIVVWMIASGSASFGSLVFGALLGWVIPLFSHRCWPDYPRLSNLSAGLKLTAIVLWDIFVANLRVALLILGPTKRLRPRFIVVDTDLDHPLAVTILTSIITLTPGTLSSQLSPNQRRILVHALDCPDEPSMVADIKRRYEAPLKELFGC